jgi:hypothetical protein
MLYALEFIFLSGPFAVFTFGFTKNAMIALGMYYGRRVILVVVKDNFI